MMQKLMETLTHLCRIKTEHFLVQVVKWRLASAVCVWVSMVAEVMHEDFLRGKVN